MELAAEKCVVIAWQTFHSDSIRAPIKWLQILVKKSFSNFSVYQKGVENFCQIKNLDNENNFIHSFEIFVMKTFPNFYFIMDINDSSLDRNRAREEETKNCFLNNKRMDT